MDVGLLFQITANNANAIQALNQFESQSGSTTAAVSSNFSRMAGSIGSMISSIGSKISSMGATLSLGITAPITAAAFALGRFGLDIQALKNQLTAFEGSSEAAEARLASLRALVDGTSGATREMAYEIYGMLKPLHTSDQTIDKTIASIARLKLGFKNLIPSDFTYNLTQIFGQGFEEQDIKQAIGQVPKFREYLVKAFGTSDNAALKEMKNSGKITMESFFTGIADAVQNDSMLAGLAEPTALRMQKFFEKSFEAVEPLANRIVEIIANLIDLALPYLEQFAAWFKNLSPIFQTIIVVIGAVAAAIGPLLVVIGSVAGAVGTLIASASGIGIAILAVIGLIVQLGPAIAVATAAVVALYKAFQVNFGGIRDYTIQAFDFIKEKIGTAMNEIYNIVQVVGGTLLGWWKDNYSQIRQTVETVSGAVKATIETFLSTISAFWSEHGERIKTFVSSAWQLIKTIIAGAIDQIRNVVHLAMQVIGGDWEKAWQSILKITESGGKSFAAIWKLFYTNIYNLLSALVPVVSDIFFKLLSKSTEISIKIVGGVIYIWKTLPQRLIELIPKFYDALKDIGAALWRGLHEGWNNAANGNNLNIPQPVVAGIDGDGVGGGLKLQQPNSTNQENPDAANARQKEREEYAKRELAAQIQILKSQLADVEKEYETTLKNLRDKFKETGDAAAFSEPARAAAEKFSLESNQIADLLESAQKQQAAEEKKTANELKLLYKEQTDLRIKFSDKVLDNNTENEKLLTDNQKKESEKRIQKNQETLQFELEQTERSYQAKQAFLNTQYARGLISEEAFQQAKQKLVLDYTSATELNGRLKTIQTSESLLNYKRSNLEQQLEAVKGNAEKENEITKQISELNNQIELEYFNQQKEREEFKKKSIEDQEKLTRELLELKIRVAEEEQRIEDFRAEQERKRLSNTLEFAKGKERLDALTKLRDFEIEEAERRNERYQENLQRELELDIQQIKEKLKNKADQENQIAEVIKLKKAEALLSEEEFQAKLKEIRDKYNPQIETEENKPSGLFGGIFASLAFGITDYLKNVALVEEANGRLQFSFSQLFDTVANMGVQAFAQLAQGFGQMVADWVLYGNQGGSSFRKMIAQILANVAQMATTYAIMCLAAAALASTVWGAALLGGTPGQFLAAAALFGAVAVTTAVVGRAVAGDSFNNNSAAKSGFASASGSSSGESGGRSSGGGGSQYSSHGDEKTVIDENRIRQERTSRHEIVLKMPRGFVVESIEQDFRDRGPVYDLITKEY